MKISDGKKKWALIAVVVSCLVALALAPVAWHVVSRLYVLSQLDLDDSRRYRAEMELRKLEIDPAMSEGGELVDLGYAQFVMKDLEETRRYSASGKAAVIVTETVSIAFLIPWNSRERVSKLDDDGLPLLWPITARDRSRIASITDMDFEYAMESTMPLSTREMLTLSTRNLQRHLLLLGQKWMMGVGDCGVRRAATDDIRALLWIGDWLGGDRINCKIMIGPIEDRHGACAVSMTLRPHEGHEVDLEVVAASILSQFRFTGPVPDEEALAEGLIEGGFLPRDPDESDGDDESDVSDRE